MARDADAIETDSDSHNLAYEQNSVLFEQIFAAGTTNRFFFWFLDSFFGNG